MRFGVGSPWVPGGLCELHVGSFRSPIPVPARFAETVFGKRTGSLRPDSVFGSKIWPPKWSLLQEEMYSRLPFWDPSFGPQNGLRPTSFLFLHLFGALQRAPATRSDVAKHVGRNACELPSLTTPLLRQLAHHHHNVHSLPDTLVSKVETVAVCERERVAHVCWGPCVKLPRRCQSNSTKFRALCRFGRQTWACVYGLFATL